MSCQRAWIRSLGLKLYQVIVLCSWTRYFTLTLSLSTQEYIWVPVNCEGILTIYKAGNLRWSKGGWQTLIHVMPQKPGMNIGCFGPLALKA